MGSWVTPACLANPWWLVWPAQPDPPWIPGGGWPAPQAEGGRPRTRPFGGPTLPPACQHQYCSPSARLHPVGLKPSAHSLHGKGSQGKLRAPQGLGRVPWGHRAPPPPHAPVYTLGRWGCWVDHQVKGWAGDGNFSLQWPWFSPPLRPTLNPNPACMSAAKNFSLSEALAPLLKEHGRRESTQPLRSVLPKPQVANWQMSQDSSWEAVPPSALYAKPRICLFSNKA